MALQLSVIAFLSLMGHFTKNPAMWIVAGAASFFTGWYWYDTFPNNLGLAFAVMIIVYGLVCWGEAIRYIFWKE